MNIVLNGEPFECGQDATISDVVEALSLEGKRYAVELNQEIVPKSEHGNVRLAEQDSLEIVQAIGGG